MAFLEVRGLTREYPNGVVALREATFSAEPGEWIAATGPSGSGKSTLVSLLALLDLPTRGEIRLDGEDLIGRTQAERARVRRERIGVVFQQTHLLPHLTAVENVMLAQAFHSLPDRAEAEAALAEVGLADRRTHLPSQLSGGEQQRVCLARALVNGPKLLLADEPTANLDEANEGIVLDHFHRLARRGVALLVVTHDPAVALLADRRLALERGRLREAPTAERERLETYDELLHEIWERAEADGAECADHASLLGQSRILEEMEHRGLLRLKGEQVELSQEGRRRAGGLVRRHRLAERLFEQKLAMSQANLEANACLFEHVLSPEVTEGICRLLGHPRACPHGRPIPPGPCCG